MRFTRYFILPALLLTLSGNKGMASDFFDKSAPEKLITFGARIGVNSSNATVNDDVYNLWNKNSWAPASISA